MATLKLSEKTLATLSAPTETAQSYYWDTELRGLGVVVGRTGRKTFVVRSRAGGAAVKRTIGVAGVPRDGDGHTWTVQLARLEARRLLGSMAEGKVPATIATRRTQHGPTLADALALHVESMRAKGGQPRSIEEFERESDKHLAAWLDRPLAEITRTECRELHEDLTEASGRYLANRVMRYLRAAWNTMLKEHDIPANPTIAVHWNKEHRRQEPVPWSKLPAQYQAILKIENPVRRDYYRTLMLTGLRKMDAATIRWEHLNLGDEPIASRRWSVEHKRWIEIDLPVRTLLRPAPKGGEDRAFMLPLSAELVRILEQRRRDNAAAGDDNGWAFPSETWKEAECHDCAALGQPAHRQGVATHLIEPREDGVSSPHRWRDTYTTACAEVGLSGFAIDVLTNHRAPKGSVTAGYIDLSTEHLAECQERVAKFLLAKATPPPKAKARGKLRAV